MSKLSKLLNPNTKQSREDTYNEHTDQKKIRSDEDNLRKFLPLCDKAESVLDFGIGFGEIVQKAPRSYHKRSGTVAAAYFKVAKP